jgi:hypothetical protein
MKIEESKINSILIWGFILITFGMLGSAIVGIHNKNLEIERLQKEKESIIVDKEILSNNLNKRIEGLENQLAVRNDSLVVSRSTVKLIVDTVDYNKTLYNIRNEKMFRNKELSLEKASYQSLVIYNESRKWNVDPFLIVAMGIVESELSHTREGVVRTSGAGAKGILQITPIVERMYKIDSNIFEENVEGSARFISDLMKQYKGDLTAALGHYNGGPRPYYKIKTISETRNYVSEVKRCYRRLLSTYK